MCYWYNTIIKQQNQKHYMNLQMEPLGNPLTTCTIQTDSDISFKSCPTWPVGWIPDSDHHFEIRLVLTRTRSWNDCLELLLSLILDNHFSAMSTFSQPPPPPIVVQPQPVIMADVSSPTTQAPPAILNLDDNYNSSEEVHIQPAMSIKVNHSAMHHKKTHIITLL